MVIVSIHQTIEGQFRVINASIFSGFSNLRSGFLFFRGGGRAKKKESLIQLLVESSAAPQLKCLSTRVSAMSSDKSEPITIYRKSLRWRESAEARSGHEVCKHLCKLSYVAFCFPTNQKKVQILDFLQTTRQVIVSGVHFSVDYTAARKITPDRRLRFFML